MRPCVDGEQPQRFGTDVDDVVPHPGRDTDAPLQEASSPRNRTVVIVVAGGRLDVEGIRTKADVAGARSFCFPLAGVGDGRSSHRIVQTENR